MKKCLFCKTPLLSNERTLCEKCSGNLAEGTKKTAKILGATAGGIIVLSKAATKILFKK